MNRAAYLVFAVLLLALSGCVGPSVRCVIDRAGRTTCVDLSRPGPGPRVTPPPAAPAPVAP